MVRNHGTCESSVVIRRWRRRIIHRPSNKKRSERLRGLSLLVVRLAIVAPELPFSESVKLILKGSKDCRHVVSDLFQVAGDTRELLFHVNAWGCCSCHYHYRVMVAFINFSVVKNTDRGLAGIATENHGASLPAAVGCSRRLSGALVSSPHGSCAVVLQSPFKCMVDLAQQPILPCSRKIPRIQGQHLDLVLPVYGQLVLRPLVVVRLALNSEVLKQWTVGQSEVRIPNASLPFIHDGGRFLIDERQPVSIQKSCYLMLRPRFVWRVPVVRVLQVVINQGDRDAKLQPLYGLRSFPGV